MVNRGIVSKLRDNVTKSNVSESLVLLRKLWKEQPDAKQILDSLHPISLYAFTHQYPSIHVPKEHEYLYRLLGSVPIGDQYDLVRDFVEYLAWSPKYIFRATSSTFSSGESEDMDQRMAYMKTMDANKGLTALYHAYRIVEDRSLEELLNTILQIGCHDISRNLGHYLSCSESVVRLARKAGMPQAKDHIFALTMNLLQYPAMILDKFQKPSKRIEEILSLLVKKGTFAGYHYMITANAMLNNRVAVGDKYFDHALHRLELVLPQLEDTHSLDFLDSQAGGRSVSVDMIADLKRFIWKGQRTEAFSCLRSYLREKGVTGELLANIVHSFTRVNRYPHDPHYVTFPVSAYELTKHVNEQEKALLMAYTIEYALDRVGAYGLKDIF